MKKWSCMLLAFLMILSLVGCNNTEDAALTNKTVYEETEYWLVKDGKSSYTIVIPEGAEEHDILAAEELQYFFSNATGYKLPIKEDKNMTADDKMISIGNTTFAEQQKLALSLDEYSVDACNIATIDDDIYICGSSVQGYGSVYGVYDFLSALFDYEYYFVDEIYIEQKENQKVLNINIVTDMDMGGRMSSHTMLSSGLNRYRYRYNVLAEVSDTPISPYHNSFSFLPPADYAESHPNIYSDDKTQLCYTAHGDEKELDFMMETIMSFYTGRMKENPGKDIYRFFLTHQDVQSWCYCEHCSKIIDKYGAKSSTQVLFMNQMSERMDTYMKENNIDASVEFIMFAYYATLQAPVKVDGDGKYYLVDDDIKPRDNVSVMFAPLSADYSVAFNEAANASTFEAMQQWNSITNSSAYWIYTVNFTDYFCPYDWYTSFEANYKLIAETEPQFLLEQCGSDSISIGTNFATLKAYLRSKLFQDSSLNVKHLTDAFFENYFKTAAEPMRQFFDTMQLRLKEEYLDEGYTGVYYSGVSTTHWSYGDISTMKGYLEEAYELVEPLQKIDKELYEKLKTRIDLESLSIRYLEIQLYSSYYQETELTKMKYEFKDICEHWGIEYQKEHGPLSDLYANWGIQ